ncbi:unnamed protein product [Dibothriocephalus latus]|uniref:Rho-GAP domain-containing protein n=1 Tax=Dibothriocephalus latus TaxID=60516 RepID=A0A3P7P4P1_DIBLA|nr:unnamed protein product [Dibothriocephalus latus]
MLASFTRVTFSILFFSKTQAVFGVPLETAIERSPSHDGVYLPAFFRQCVDFIEEYGLATEGIYRVPGVNSQVKAIIDALNRGIEFPDIPPSSPTYASPSPCQPARRTSGECRLFALVYC